MRLLINGEDFGWQHSRHPLAAVNLTWDIGNLRPRRPCWRHEDISWCSEILMYIQMMWAPLLLVTLLWPVAIGAGIIRKFRNLFRQN